MSTSTEDAGLGSEVVGSGDGRDVPVHDLGPAPAQAVSDRLLADSTARDWLGANADPDVLLSVPHLGVDEITFELRDLRAHVSLEAQVLDLVKLNVGADVSLGEVNLRVAGVRAQAMLKVRLDNVSTIVGDVVALLDRRRDVQGRHAVAYDEPPTALTAEPPAESVVVAEVVPDAPQAAPPDAASEAPAG